MSDKTFSVNTCLYFFVKCNGREKMVEMISDKFSNSIFLKKPFCLTLITLKSSVITTPTDWRVMRADAGSLAKEITSGNFEFKIGDEFIFPKGVSYSIFTKTNGKFGYYKLDKPKWIYMNTKISFIIRTNTFIKANTNILLELIGTKRLKY